MAAITLPTHHLFVNHTGNVYGILTCIEYAGRNRHGQHRWRCKCQCGKEITTSTSLGSSSAPKSCGCDRNLPSGPAHKHFVDLTGKTYGRLTVVGLSEAKKSKPLNWRCVCICGKTVCVVGSNLVRGNSTSCGCYSRELATARETKHGETKLYGPKKPSVEYTAYYGAKARCENSYMEMYKCYGGRGIEFRFTSFEQFLAEVGRRPSSLHSLDRIDVNGHYEPGNVRWATKVVQANNTRSNRFLVFRGESMTLSQLSRLTGVQPRVISKRLLRGWCMECAATIPKSHRTVGKICKHTVT